MASCKGEDCVTMTDDVLVSIDSFLAYSQHPNVSSLRTWVGHAGAIVAAVIRVTFSCNLPIDFC